MKDIEYILDFAAQLGSRLLTSGAPLERADDTMYRVMTSYGLKDISIFSLNRVILLSARSSEGEYASRQVSVRPMDIHLGRLNRLNTLSRHVCKSLPEPAALSAMLLQAEEGKEYSVWTILLGRMIATVSLTILFGGTWMDVLAASIVVYGLFWLILALGRANLNQIIVNMLCMFYSGSAAAFLVNGGVGENYFILIITCSMVMVPGIPLVNAARNLLCANEMNGILEILRAVVETLALVLGLVVAIYLFGGNLS